MHQMIGQPELLKEINRSRVFGILKNTRIVSRSDLAQQTGLSRATIAIMADQLLRAGLVEEIGLGNSTGGRPPTLLRFNPNAAYALGAHLRDRSWSVVVTNLDAQVLTRLDVPLANDTPETTVEALTAGVATIAEQFGRQRILPAIGLGTPGLVDMTAGVVKTAPDVGWTDVPIRDMVEHATGLKVFVANRSKVGALAEFWYGATRAASDLVYIAIGTGVSAGIIHQGQLYMGANSSAGEVGHITVLPEGPLCPCGNRGCLQQLIAGPSIASRTRERMRVGSDSALHTLVGHHPELITAPMVFQAAEQGDALACEIVSEIARYLGIAVANIINLFNPEMIILGGPIGEAGRVLLEPLQIELRRRALTHLLSAVQITTSTLGPDASAIGAAALVLQQASDLLFANASQA
jgi:glucokinase-like ROK family protein